MTLQNHFKTLSPFIFTAEDELRLSVKKGLDVHFFKLISKLDGNCLDEIINKVKVIFIYLPNTYVYPLPITFILHLFRNIFLMTIKK